MIIKIKNLVFLYIIRAYYFSATTNNIHTMDPRFSEETIECIRTTAKYATPSTHGLQVVPMREQMEILFEKSNESLLGTFQGSLEEQNIKINSAEIPVTVYKPVNFDKEKLGIYFHGGGWLMCSRKTHQTIVNSLADMTSTIWISVEYRLAPEYKFPVSFNDAAEVTEYIIENKQSFGVNKTAKVGVAGDSVGATISTSLARSIKNIDFQILIYGVFDLALNTASGKEFTSPMYFATPQFIDWLKATVFENEEQTQDRRVAILRNTSFQGLPPCLLIAAELDRFRDDSYEYQKLLQRDGVRAELVLIKGVVHGYVGTVSIFKQACEQTLLAIRDFMKSI